MDDKIMEYSQTTNNTPPEYSLSSYKEEDDDDEEESKIIKIGGVVIKRNSAAATSSINSTTITTELGNGSQVMYIPSFFFFFLSKTSSSTISSSSSWELFDYLNKNIPWTRPTLRVFGRNCLQPRDTCYVACPGLEQLRYSGYQPHAYSWDQFPPLKHILDAVHEAFPGSCFNSLLLNRYKGGNDYVGWHADDEKLYGPTPEIASLSLGCDREFLLKKRPTKPPSQAKRDKDEAPPSKRLKKSKTTQGNSLEQHSFMLKHGSLLMMRGYTQRDWLHSVPKRAKADSTRINLTFRRVL